MFLLRLGVLNLLRHVRRTLLSLGAIVTGTSLFLVGQGFVGGMSENIIRAQTDTVSGHLMALPKDYPTERLQQPIDVLIQPNEAQRAWLDGNAEAWTTRTRFAATLSNGRDSQRTVGLVFDPRTDEAVFPRDTWTVEGKIPLTEADGVLVARGPARLLDLTVGGTVVLQSRSAKGAINALSVPVAGIVTTANPMLDTGTVFVPLALGESLLRLDGGATHVHLRLKDREQADALAAGLVNALGEHTAASSWRDETKDILEIQEVRRQAMNFLLAAMLGIAATSIANTILMAAYERVREIGTLRAMGLTRSGVLTLFVWEGLLMGLVGGIVGAGLGGSATAWWAANPIDLAAMMKDAPQSGVPMSQLLYMQFSPTLCALSVLFAVIVAAGASVYPAIVASRMVPADAVRAD